MDLQDIQHRVATAMIDRLKQEKEALVKERDEWKQRAERIEDDLRKLRAKFDALLGVGEK